ncbi:MAG: type I-E CRISPR-associated protein Cas6/Cse3/CasE [Dehalococcoidia bacterium]|nr:type I-E CRISPR-associated protein Cas6/Cse3/CasE [Dehalococcoidia bacterium]
MYLSRLTLNLRDANARRWLGDCHELHRALLRGFGDSGDQPARREFGVLHRVEMTPGQPVRVLVQSAAAPRWAFEARAVVGIDGPASMDRLLDRIAPGRRYRFRLRANPTRRVHQRATMGPDLRELDTHGNWRDAGEIAEHERTYIARRDRAEDVAWKGKRVELTREEDRIAWLARRGREFDGFELVAAQLAPGPGGAARDYFATRADPGGRMEGRKPGWAPDRRMTLGTALFEGVLEVTDGDRLRAAIAEGIGPGKAFGCGLLSLAPVDG